MQFGAFAKCFISAKPSMAANMAKLNKYGTLAAGSQKSLQMNNQPKGK